MSRLFIIEGVRSGGKTVFIDMVVTQLGRSTLPLFGFLSKAVSRQTGRRENKLFLVHPGEEIPFSSEVPVSDWMFKKPTPSMQPG